MVESGKQASAGSVAGTGSQLSVVALLVSVMMMVML